MCKQSDHRCRRTTSASSSVAGRFPPTSFVPVRGVFLSLINPDDNEHILLYAHKKHDARIGVTSQNQQNTTNDMTTHTKRKKTHTHHNRCADETKRTNTHKHSEQFSDQSSRTSESSSHHHPTSSNSSFECTPHNSEKPGTRSSSLTRCRVLL